MHTSVLILKGWFGPMIVLEYLLKIIGMAGGGTLISLQWSAKFRATPKILSMPKMGATNVTQDRGIVFFIEMLGVKRIKS